jgi:hypothetical protein
MQDPKVVTHVLEIPLHQLGEFRNRARGITQNGDQDVQPFWSEQPAQIREGLEIEPGLERRLILANARATRRSIRQADAGGYGNWDLDTETIRDAAPKRENSDAREDAL